MTFTQQSARWSDVKTALESCDRQILTKLVQDLYESSAANRRFLHARYVPSAQVLEDYRRLVSEAVAPDPFSQTPTRLRDATKAISDYRRSTGDIAGAVDLMLEFVEAGTARAADLGSGDDAYFSAMERKVNEVVRALEGLSEAERAMATARLVELGLYRDRIGWGYGDFLHEIAAELQAREAVQVVRRTVTRSDKALQPVAPSKRRRRS